MTETVRPPALDPEAVAPRHGSSYPRPFAAETDGRSKQVLGDALGLTNFGVNLVRLEPGAWSAQRHWHSHEDEFVYVLEGEITLVTDEGAQVLGPGMTAGFPAGVENGHRLVNRGAAPAVYLEIGDRRSEDTVHYPDIDLVLRPGAGGRVFMNRKGEPY